MKKQPKLREWQNTHLQKALNRFKQYKIFLSQAVTGAGKTMLGVIIALALLKTKKIDRVVVLCPSVEIASSWKIRFEEMGVIATTIDIEAPDVVALVATYAGGDKIPGTSKTLAILDEIHHAEREHAWGLTASALAIKCAFVLVLTGTPWMTRGKIAILEKNNYYKPDKDGVIRIEADAEYRYEDDLYAADSERATVPVQCFFYKSETVRKYKDDQGLDQIETLILEEPTPSNVESIIKKANDEIPLGPHVFLDDDQLSNNRMARDLLAHAVTDLENMNRSRVFRTARTKAMGLVSCRTIIEAGRVARYLEAVHGQIVEIIVSDDTGSAKRLRDIAEGRVTPPTWIVSVGMVSEGVDIPAIKVIACLNQITTMLFLIQLIGRALRRIQVASKIEGDEKQAVYLDQHSLNETPAHFHAPAHPMIVKVGKTLEKIANAAVKKLMDKPSSKPIDNTPKPRPKWETDGAQASTSWFRGVAVPAQTKRNLIAIEQDDVAMDSLGPHWFMMMMDWIAKGRVDEAQTEIERIIKLFDIVIHATDDSDDSSTETATDYDTQAANLKREAQRYVARIRFTSPQWSGRPESPDVYKEIRMAICQKMFRRWVPFKKMTLKQKEKWVELARAEADRQ